MDEKLVIPLFVLSQGIFPSSKEPLRVFEPRYKQMLDDCVMDDLPFGFIAANVNSELIDGWTPPCDYGVLSNADNISEQGTNLLFLANGKKRFRINEIIPAALPSEEFDDVFPSVDELVEQYIEEFPNGKLYLRAEIEILQELKGEIEQKRWEDFILSWSKHIFDMNLVFGGNPIDSENLSQMMIKEFTPYSELKLWDVCNSVLDTNDIRQKALCASDSEEIIDILETNLKWKDAQMRYINGLVYNEEE